MTLEEAIKQYEEKAKEIRWQALKERMDIEEVAEYETCAEEYEQLAEWLEELKARREAENDKNYPINQEENCKIVCEFLRDVASIKDLPPCKECSTCEHCRKKYKKLPKIIWMNNYPFIFCTRHHEHFAPGDTCEFWKGGAE